MELNLYNKEGKLKTTVSPADSSTLTEGLMTDYILSLSFVLFDCVPLDVNDYVDFLGKRYWMLEAYLPNQKSTIEWNYSVKFYGIESVIRRALCLKTVDNEMNAVFSLTAPAIEHVRLVVQNINRVMGTTDWKVGEVEATANLTIDYNGTYCDAALASIATAADTEWWIDGLTVNLCRCEYGELISLGYGSGLREITLDTNENAKFFTRLFPLGSTRNIDASKYGSTRLHLPGGVKYVEQNTHYGVIEHSEEAAFSDIYPRRIGKVGIVRHETKKGEDGKDFDIYYFTDPEIDFDPNKYEIPNQKKNIVFETGDLAGHDFEVNYNTEKKEFEVITQWPYDDETQLPGGLVMKPTDEYILYNITMPTEYYPRAEQEFAAAVTAYMEKNKRDKSVYKAPTDYIDLNERKMRLTVGQRVRLLSDTYFPVAGYRDSRITKITRKVNETLQADIEISDLADPGGKATLTQGISQAKHYAQAALAGLPDMIKSWENTPASDSNLYAAKKTDKEIRNRAISRQYNDYTDGHITFKNGLLVKSTFNRRQLKSVISQALSEEGDPDVLGHSLIEEGNGNPDVLSTALMEESSFGGGTIGSLENVDESFDTVPDDTYSFQKRNGIFYPVKGGGASSQYILRLINNLPSLNLYIVKGEPAYLDFTFTSQTKEADELVNTEERGYLQISVMPENGQYKEVLTTYIPSGSATRIDVSKYITTNKAAVMVKVTGEVSGKIAPTLTYAAQTTTLSISADNFQWWNIFEKNPLIPVNIGGNVNKVLHVDITGADYSESYDVNLGTVVYTETAYNYSLPHTNKTGVYNVSLYVITSDGSIKTKTVSFNIIMILTGAGEKLIAVNNILPKVTNWGENRLFDFCMYDQGRALTSAEFVVEKDSESVYSSINDRISTGSKQSFSIPLEIETIDNTDFDITAKVKYDGLDVVSLVYLVDNSLGFSATGGAVLYINPRTRNNNQSNYKSVVNEMTGESISATWNNLNWGNDGWVSDGNANILRLLAGSSVDINYKPFAVEPARTGKSVEMDIRVNNITDYDKQVFSIVSSAASFVGLKIYPDNIIMHSQSLQNDAFQTININDGQRIRISLVIMPDAYGNSGFNLCIIYIDGKKNREFNYQNNDYFAHNGDIVIGSDYADIDLFGIRIYDTALTSDGVQRNYINWQESNAVKKEIQEHNDVFDPTGSEISYEKVKSKLNTFVFDGQLPSLSNPNKFKGNLRIEFAKNPEFNVTITEAECRGQGTSSMRYWWWNLQWRLNKLLSNIIKEDGTIDIGFWRMLPFLPSSGRITAKKNFASSMQSHKMGSVNSINDLYREMGYRTEAMMTEGYENTRIAVYQEPFVGFQKTTNSEGEDIYTFKGIYTMGPDKGDANTFGYDIKKFPGLLSIEGSDNAPLCTLFRIPWNVAIGRVVYNPDEEAWQYNGVNSWDFDGGSESNIDKWIPAYNIAYVCSPRLKPFNGTLDELKAQTSILKNEPCEYWIAKEGDVNQYNVYYYEASTGEYVPSDIGEGTINLLTQLTGKGYGLIASDLAGKTPEQNNDLFIKARVSKFRKEAPLYWNINDSIFQRNWVEFNAGTDQRAKNTYPYTFGGLWCWRVDDTDTIFSADNQGQAKKSYYVEIGDKYPNGSPVWNGETSNFWNLLDMAFPEEIVTNMREMMSKMESLGELNTGDDFDKLYAYYDKYYFEKAQKYFPISIYNADAKFTYETAKLAYIAGIYTNDTDPITQSLGDHFSAEQRWIMRRIVYMMSKYSFGMFSAAGTDNITVRASGNTIRYELTPAIDLYPAIASGTSIIRGNRTKAGQVCKMDIDLAGSGDQQNTIQGASYLQDIGEWYDKQVSGSMIVQGRRLREVKLGHKNEPITISISSLTISNCPSLQKLILSRISTLMGTLNLSSCFNLKEIHADGTGLSQIVMPKGGGLEIIEYSSNNQYINLQNFPLLKKEGVVLGSSKEIVTDFLVDNCPSINPMDLLLEVYRAQEAKKLKRIRCGGFKDLATDEIIDMLYDFATGDYNGLDENGLPISGKPVFFGSLLVKNIDQVKLDAITAAFPEISIYTEDISVFQPIENGNIQLLLEGKNTSITIQSISSEYVINWGDGNSTHAKGIGIQTYAHTYAEDMYYQAEISHVKDVINCENKDSIIAYWSVGDSRVESLFFTDYIKLKAVGAGVFKNDGNRTNFQYCFENCVSLKTIPSGLFDACVKATNFAYCFNKCSILINIPQGLFDKNIEVTSFVYVFGYCSSLQVIPQGLFDNNTKLTSLFAGFIGCTSIEAIPDKLLDKNIELQIVQSLFNGCGSIKYIPSGFFDKNTKITSVSLCFYNCKNLQEIPLGLFDNNPRILAFLSTFLGTAISIIPSGLFDNCPLVTNFNSCFQNCINLISIPERLFDKNVNVTSFSYTFYGCSLLESIPLGLFDKNIKNTMFNDCFGKCLSISHIPAGLFDNCPLVTTFNYCFQGCSSLVLIPENLFKFNTEAELFTSCFRACISLTYIPVGLFDYNLKATAFNYLFGDCTGIETIPNGLFANNSLVTISDGIFSYCKSLKAIPTGIFDSMPLMGNAYNMFYGCELITEIPVGLFNNNLQIKSFGGTFYKCPILSIPTGLFDNNPLATDFNFCFSGTSITEIPIGLFANNPLVINFDSCFAGCNLLQNIPIGLFDYNVNVTSFAGTFMMCTSLQAIPQELFKNNTLVNSVAECFRSCISLTSIPDGLFDNMPLIENFGLCFGFCESITAIPIGLFKNNTKVTNFVSIFNTCRAIVYIPSGLFDNNPLVTSFASAFNECSKIEAIPPRIFDNNPLVESFNSVFVRAAISEIPIGLFDKNVNATNFGFCFRFCVKITSIPEKLFDNNVKAESFGYCFGSCSGLLSVPIGLFDKNVNATGFNYAFYGCNNIPLFISRLTSFGFSMFSYCAKLAEVQVPNETVVPMIDSTCFIGTNAALRIKVPAELVTKYKTATNWLTYADKIEAI